MNTPFRLLATVFVLTFATFARAGDFVSMVVQGQVPAASFTIDVPGNRILVIRNFTQEGTATPLQMNTVTIRGMIKAQDRTGHTATVLTATIADTDPLNCLEPVNDVVIAGPSTVTVYSGDTSCFLTYRKGED